MAVGAAGRIDLSWVQGELSGFWRKGKICRGDKGKEKKMKKKEGIRTGKRSGGGSHVRQKGKGKMSVDLVNGSTRTRPVTRR